MNENNINKLIALELYRLGLKPKGKGYAYLRECIKMIEEDCDATVVFNKDVYPKLAHLFKTTPASIQRNMANCVDKAFLKSDYKSLEKEFGDLINYQNGKITLKQFVLHIVEKLRLKNA